MRLTSAKQIPPKIQACASAYRLGSPRIMYQPRTASSLHLFFGPLALMLGVLIIAVYISLYDSIFSWWPTWQAFLVPGVGIAWLGIGCWIMGTPLIFPHLRVFLCPGGLIYVKRAREVIRWDEIAVLSKRVEIDKTGEVLYSYMIRRSDGTPFELSHDLPYLDRLGRFMERESARHILPRVLAAYKAGTTQEFADILVNSNGIILKTSKKLLPWSELEKLVIDDTTITLYRKGETWAWATLGISDIPNTAVLQGLVRHIRSEAREQIYKGLGLTRSAQMDAYDAGFSVFFGPLHLSKAGITLNNSENILSWDEIDSVGVNEHEVIIKRIGMLDEWYTIPTWTISNLSSLRQMIDYALWQRQ